MNIDTAREILERVSAGEEGLPISFEDVKGIKFSYAFVNSPLGGHPTVRFFWGTAQHPEGLETLDHECIDECLLDFARSETSVIIRAPELSAESRSQIAEILTASDPDTLRRAISVVLSNRARGLA